MATIRFGYTPTHPGEVLKDEIEYRKVSQRKLAEQMGISYKVLNDLLNGRRALTTATAMMFEAALGVPADSLMRLHTLYGHMRSVATSAGKYVNQGDLIGYVGSTGNSTGNHLHLEVWKGGSKANAVNPRGYIPIR